MRRGQRSDLTEIALRLRQLKFVNDEHEIELHNMARRLEEIARQVHDGEPLPRNAGLL